MLMKKPNEQFEENGVKWMVVKLDPVGQAFYASKIVEGKKQKGRPHKFLVETPPEPKEPEKEPELVLSLT